VSKTEAEKFAERMRRNTGADEAVDRGSCSLRSWWLLRQSCSAKHQTQKLAKDRAALAPHLITKGCWQFSSNDAQ